MSKATARALLTLLAGGGLCGAAHADRPEFAASLGVDEVTEFQLSGAGDEVTYSNVTGGVTAQIKNRRVVLSSAYTLTYRIPELGQLDKSVSQNGILRAQANIIEQWLSLDGGAIVTRSRVDPSGAAPLNNSPNAQNLTETYSFFAQPQLFHRFGDVAVSSTYRYAYTKNQGKELGANANPLANRFDSSINQEALLSVGIKRGFLPFDWKGTLSTTAENSGNLAKHARAWTALGDITMPVAETIALVASGGYEKQEISEKEPLLDPLTGFAVLDKYGRFVVDPASPRTLIYDMSGLIADAGVIWKPSRRTRMEARVGYRYGGVSITGLIEIRPSKRDGLSIVLTDRFDSFGGGISSGLAGSSADLDLNQSNDPSTPLQNCLFGKQAGSGRCIGGALGNAAAASYREQGLSVIYTHGLRRWNINASGGYTRRTYYDQPGTLFSLDGVVDQSFFGSAGLSGTLTRTSRLSFSFSGNLFKNGQVGASDVISGSFATDYYRTFGRGIRLSATLAIDASKADGTTADVSGRAQLGLQYGF